MTLHDLTDMSPNEAQAAIKRLSKKPHKYGAQRTEYDGQLYDSKAEADYAARLDALLKAGEIVDWQRAAPLVLVDAEKRADRITYRPDFWVTTKDSQVYHVDVKGVETPVWKLKVRLLKHLYPAVRLLIVGKDGERWL